MPFDRRSPRYLAAGVEAIAVHVLAPSSVPRFLDGPADAAMWVAELAALHVADLGVRLEVRVGEPVGTLLQVAETEDVDVVALGWRQDLSPERSRVVRGILAQSTRPVALGPVPARDLMGARADTGPVADAEARARAVAALMETTFLMERALADSRRTGAYRRAQGIVAAMSIEEFGRRLRAGSFTEIPGIGPSTNDVIVVAAGGGVPERLAEARALPRPDADDGWALVEALRGDLHAHSEWSDGATPIEDMAETARALGHEYLALTDHSPRLTVANGLSRERLERQLEVVAALNERWDCASLRLLTGIEVDILDDGALDQDEDLLARLDVVVASVHSKLRMPAREMTPRMVAAVENPVVTVLGHCTGRMTMGRADRHRIRPPSEFDAEAVFTACQQAGVAVEINCRPERRDPPSTLLTLAVELGCSFSIDTDAHAPGQLAWLPYGAARAAACGVTADRVINTRTATDLVG